MSGTVVRLTVAHVNQLGGFRACGGRGTTASWCIMFIGVVVEGGMNTMVVVIMALGFVVVEESFHAQVVGLVVDAGLCVGEGGVVVDEVEGGVLTTHDQWQGNSARGGVMMLRD